MVQSKQKCCLECIGHFGGVSNTQFLKLFLFEKRQPDPPSVSVTSVILNAIMCLKVNDIIMLTCFEAKKKKKRL